MQQVWFIVLLVACLSAPSGGQFSGVCPDQWETNGGNCYQFVFNPARNYDDAASACWTQGSALVSINSYSEFNYIREYINTHGQEGYTKWYTSGKVQGSYIKWNGDGTYTNSTGDANYWVDPNYNSFIVIGDRIIYSYSTLYRRYAWSKATGSDVLNYICEIPVTQVRRLVQQTRDFEFGNANVSVDKIPKGPHFMTVPENEVIIDSYNPLHLECLASGYPQPTYKWFVSSPQAGNHFDAKYEQITSSTNSRYTFSNGRLTMTEPTEDPDAGTYQCRAENNAGSIHSAPVLISFGYLNQFSPNQQGFVQAKLMQGSYINCRAPSSKPALGYQWYKDNIRNFIRPELNKYFFISSNGNLYFSEVQDTDKGNYFCVVTLIPRVGEKLTSSQSVSRTSRAIELRVAGNPSLDYGPIIHPDFIAVFPKPPLIGHDVRMECFAYGRLPLVYSWSRENGRSFPSGTRFMYDNRVMIIPNAKFEDGGNYTCKVIKFTGQQSVAEKSIYLTLEAKPYFLFPLRNVHADVGSELTWRCEARSVPQATYTWYKNSVVLNHIPGQREIRTNVLVIKRLDKSRDQGMYQCAATNAHGTSITSAQLRVLSVMPNFMRYPLPVSMVAAEGGNITIKCQPEAAPQPQITWALNGGDIGYGDVRREILVDGTLHVTQVSAADQGTYTCKASNALGEAQSQTRVTVMRGVRFQTTPVNTVGSVNTTVFLYCEATYNYNRYDLTYLWSFNGRIIDTRNSYFYFNGERNNVHGLYIRNAQYYHTGTYECIAQTVMVSISTAAYVQITGPPSEPAGVHVEAQDISFNDSARVIWTWNPEANHGFPVRFFDIETMNAYSKKWELIASDLPASFTISPERDMMNYYDVKNLLPYNSYQFRVRAKNDKGVGPSSRPSGSYRVGMAKPIKAPSNVGGGGGSVGVLTITWEALKPEEEGGPDFGYRVFWKKQGQQAKEWAQAEVGRANKHVPTLTKDDFFLLYEVKVEAFNRMGDGPISPPVAIYSAEGMPGARPTNVKFVPINGTAVTVTWDPVPSTRETVRGRVLGYQIDYINLKYCDNSKCENASSNNQNRRFVYCQNCSSGIIIGLEPNADYWVDVVLFNHAGRGVPSEKYKVSTYENAPGRFPQFVDVYPHGEHSALIKWRGVDIIQGEATLNGYKLMYWPVGDDVRTANFTMIEVGTEGVIYGLQTDIIYKLRVMGVNRGGDGKKSSTVYFTVTKDGSININRATFDPSTSQFLIAAADSNYMNIFLTCVGLLMCVLKYV